MKTYSLLLLSGGIGSRINIGKPKQFIQLNGIPMIVYSLLAIKDIDSICEVIINYPKKEKKQLNKFIKLSGISKKIKLVSAGKTRQSSVYKMLKKATSKHVIIHESARPLVSKKSFRILINEKNKNCGYMNEIPFTIIPVDNSKKIVTGSVNRDDFKNVQLPQKFNTKKLKKAHKIAHSKNLVFTEDSGLFVNNKEKFYFIDGDDRNIKITYKNDLIVAERLLKIDNDEEN